MGEHDYAPARPLLRAAIDDEQLPQERARLLNLLAWADVMLGDPELLGEADRASAEALELEPFELAIVGTRGSMLVALGRPAEAMALLERSGHGATRPVELSATACWIALGAVQLGDVFRARRELATAVRADASFPLVDWVRTEVAGAEARHLTTQALSGDVATRSERIVAMREALGPLSRSVSASVRAFVEGEATDQDKAAMLGIEPDELSAMLDALADGGRSPGRRRTCRDSTPCRATAGSRAAPVSPVRRDRTDSGIASAARDSRAVLTQFAVGLVGCADRVRGGGGLDSIWLAGLSR